MRWVGMALIFFGAVDCVALASEVSRANFNWGSTHDIRVAGSGFLISILLIALGQYLVRRNPKI